jgi:Spy/CpxP family protein refolding chaperone
MKARSKKKERQFMKMHKVSLLVALAAGALIAFTPTLRAENKPERPDRSERPGGAPGQPGDMLKKMAEELGLSDEQKAKLGEAFKAQREAMKDLSPEERREKMKESREAMNAKVKEILTAEQYAKWEKIRDERRPGGPGGPGKEAGAGEKRGPGGKKKN